MRRNGLVLMEWYFIYVDSAYYVDISAKMPTSKEEIPVLNSQNEWLYLCDTYSIVIQKTLGTSQRV